MTSDETPAERRLRTLAILGSAPYIGSKASAAIDMGREALALLREYQALDSRNYQSTDDWHEAENKWDAKARTLLARAGEDG